MMFYFLNSLITPSIIVILPMLIIMYYNVIQQKKITFNIIYWTLLILSLGSSLLFSDKFTGNITLIVVFLCAVIPFLILFIIRKIKSNLLKILFVIPLSINLFLFLVLLNIPIYKGAMDGFAFFGRYQQFLSIILLFYLPLSVIFLFTIIKDKKTIGLILLIISIASLAVGISKSYGEDGYFSDYPEHIAFITTVVFLLLIGLTYTLSERITFFKSRIIILCIWTLLALVVLIFGIKMTHEYLPALFVPILLAVFMIALGLFDYLRKSKNLIEQQ